MWNEIVLAGSSKWVKTDARGRITARIFLKDGEYRASRLAFNADGVGEKNYLGSFISLDHAKAAVDPVVEARSIET